ncbi:N-acetylmuramoyl-L-alanine amidase [uncultured Selenomonas sp.]|uniref:N-acetylmuramoyl-L-alanine amidase family protein n=1 Tax=uncultured Selenomonas sp. TaxID=159275 RepID=UPI0028D0CB08|nr:N-acetylmuramoyl-L-alanine amidase [uncultured Selenomonas sp.]
MRVFLNPGHAPNGNPDPGACGCGLRECDVAKSVADLVEHYLVAAGVEVVGNLQDDSLYAITNAANASSADIFVSIHCNAFNGSAQGTEVEVHPGSSAGRALGNCIQRQIVDSLGTADRGLKDRLDLWVIKRTDMPAVLVELAFIDHEGDAALLRDRQDDFARAIARGVTDYAAQ